MRHQRATRAPGGRRPLPGAAPSWCACWRRLATTVLGTGGLLGLLVVSMLGVGYLLPAPMLVVPVAAATAVTVHITARSRDVRAVAATPRRLTDAARATHVDAAPRRRRTMPAWPTGRHRRASLRAAAHVRREITASPWRTSRV